MNKKALRIAGWALSLSMAVAGIGAAVGAAYAVNANEPLMANATSADNFVSLAAGKGTSGSGSSVTITSGGITLTFSKGYGTSTTEFRDYASGTIKLAFDSSVDSVDSISMTITGGKDGGTWTGATSSNGVVTWDSTSQNATVSHTAQARYSAIVVEYTYAENGTVSEDNPGISYRLEGLLLWKT